MTEMEKFIDSLQLGQRVNITYKHFDTNKKQIVKTGPGTIESFGRSGTGDAGVWVLYDGDKYSTPVYAKGITNAKKI